MSIRFRQLAGSGRMGVIVWSVVVFFPMTVFQIYSSSTGKTDFPAHLAAAQHLLHGQIEVPHLLFHLLVAGLSVVSRIGVAAVVVITASQVALCLLVFEILRDALDAGPYRDRAVPLASLASFLLVIAAPLSFVTFPNLMLGYLTPTTYHNPTIIVLKPLALAQFLLTARVFLADTRSELRPRPVLALVAVTFLATLAKPAYAIVALPVIALCLLAYRRGKDIRNDAIAFVLVGAAAGVVLAWQYVFLYRGGSADGGIAWAPLMVVHGFEPNNARLVLKVLLSLAFPLAVALTDLRGAIRDRPLVYCWLCLAVSLLYYYLLMERGERYWHGNLGWGVLVAVFLLFFQSLVHLVHGLTPGSPSFSQKASLALLGIHAVAGAVWYVAMLGVFPQCAALRFGWCW